MDFFEHQDRARRTTLLMLALYPVLIAGVVVAVYALARVAVVVLSMSGDHVQIAQGPFWNAGLLWPVAGLTTLFILAMAAYKFLQLSDGASLARLLDGTRVPPDTDAPAPRRLRNVVEEMALASGLPVPDVFILENETAINAFVSGNGPNDAVVTMTRGAVDNLSRDELQGVAAHEFSHILNGDMRLNMRLLGLLFGLQALSHVGRFILERFFRGSSSGGKLKAILALVGFGLLLIGAAGSFAALILRALVSRQREFLADAAAVQFTRNPQGILGALRKISTSGGAHIQHPAAPQAMHMYFDSGELGFLRGITATHPPLDERIRRIDPQVADQISYEDSVLDRAMASYERTHSPAGFSNGPDRSSSFAPPAFLPGYDPADAQAMPAGIAAPDPQRLAAHPARRAAALIGTLNRHHLAYARMLQCAIPLALRTSSHTPLGASATIFAQLMDDDPAMQARQRTILEQCGLPGVAPAALALRPLVAGLETRLRLPLLTLTETGLARLSSAQYDSFRQAVDALVRLDGRMSVFEWMLLKILDHQLQPLLSGRKDRPIRHYVLAPVARQAEVVLSAMARAGQREDDAVRRAFDQGAGLLGLPGLTLASREDCGLKPLEEALAALGTMVIGQKRNLVNACAAVLAADGKATVAEAELLRAFCAMLDCPMPPLLPGQSLG